MRKSKKMVTLLMALMILFSALPMNARADSFEYPEDYSIYSYQGFICTDDKAAVKNGCTKILYYKGKKTSVTVPTKIKGKKVISISGYGKIKNLHVPNGIKIENIGDADCLKKVTVNKNNKDYCVSNKMLFNKKKTSLYWCPRDIANPKIPKTIKTIQSQAFCGSKLKKVTIPEKVTTIGREAFAFCKNLEQVKWNKKLKKIEYAAFRDCTALKSIVIPDSVEIIENGAFSGCKKLQNVKLSNKLKELYAMFYGCKFKEMKIPKSVTLIDEGTFQYIESLKKVYIYNKDCEIKYYPDYKEINAIPKNIVIYGYKGSTAEKYAKKNGNKFIELK